MKGRMVFVAAAALIGLWGTIAMSCVTDFQGGAGEYANGCKRCEQMRDNQLSITNDTAPWCMTVVPPAVGSSKTVSISIDGESFDCCLRGGTSTGATGTVDQTNPIETQRSGTCHNLRDGAARVDISGDISVIPFFCEGNPAKAGAIFVDGNCDGGM